MRNLLKKRETDKKYQREKRKKLKGYKTEEFRKWRLKNPEKYRAQGKLNKAIKYGKIKRLSCEICGNKKSHGHHPDYSKPLEVIWLCSIHHKKEHSVNH